MEDVEKLPEAYEIMKLPISYEEKGIKKGKEIGKKERTRDDFNYLNCPL